MSDLFKTLRTLIKMAVGLSVTMAGLGAVFAFGMFAWVGMPILAVGLGLFSSAVDEI